MARLIIMQELEIYRRRGITTMLSERAEDKSEQKYEQHTFVLSCPNWMSYNGEPRYRPSRANTRLVSGQLKQTSMVLGHSFSPQLHLLMTRYHTWSQTGSAVSPFCTHTLKEAWYRKNAAKEGRTCLNIETGSLLQWSPSFHEKRVSERIRHFKGNVMRGGIKK